MLRNKYASVMLSPSNFDKAGAMAMGVETDFASNILTFVITRFSLYRGLYKRLYIT
jgi:hypothetical protein